MPGGGLPPSRPYTGWQDIDYPLHDKTIVVTRCGRVCLGNKKINFSFAGQQVVDSHPRKHQLRVKVRVTFCQTETCTMPLSLTHRRPMRSTPYVCRGQPGGDRFTTPQSSATTLSRSSRLVNDRNYHVSRLYDAPIIALSFSDTMLHPCQGKLDKQFRFEDVKSFEMSGQHPGCVTGT
jgi:hypothetical protein